MKQIHEAASCDQTVGCGRYCPGFVPETNTVQPFRGCLWGKELLCRPGGGVRSWQAAIILSESLTDTEYKHIFIPL